MTSSPAWSVDSEHRAAHPGRLRIYTANIQQFHGLVRFSLIHWPATTGDSQLSLAAKVAHTEGRVDKASPWSNDVLRKGTHPPQMGGSHSNRLDRELQSNVDNV
jgi:hypothetical protein